MAEHAEPIDIDDVPELLRLAEEVHRGGEPRVLRKDAKDLAVVSPLPTYAKKSCGRAKTTADCAALQRAAGGWADINTDNLIADIYEDRRGVADHCRARKEYITAFFLAVFPSISGVNYRYSFWID